MADTETKTKAKGERAAASDKTPRPEKGEKSQQAQKPDRAGKPAKVQESDAGAGDRKGRH